MSLDFCLSLVACFFLFGAGYWAIYSAGLIEDISIPNLSKVFIGIVLMLAAMGFAIRAMLALAHYLELA